MPFYTGEPITSKDVSLDELTTPLGQSLGAVAEDTLVRSPGPSLYRAAKLGIANNFSDSPILSQDDAFKRSSDLGIKLNIPVEGISQDAFDILAKTKQEEIRRTDLMTRGPKGVAAGAAKIGTALGASLLDPLNIAAAFVPVVGEARYASVLANATGTVGRILPRAAVGFAEGLVGTAALEPIVYGAAKYEQADFDMADAATDVLFGGVFGAGMHSLGGTAADLYRGFRGKEDPFTRLRGLNIDEINQVHAADSIIRLGDKATPEQLASLTEYPDRVLKAAGLEISPEGVPGVSRSIDQTEPSIRTTEEAAPTADHIASLLSTAGNKMPLGDLKTLHYQAKDLQFKLDDLDAKAENLTGPEKDAYIEKAKQAEPNAPARKLADLAVKLATEDRAAQRQELQSALDRVNGLIEADRPAREAHSELERIRQREIQRARDTGRLDTTAQPNDVLVRNLTPDTRRAASSTAVGQLASGKGVEISPIVESDPLINTATSISIKGTALRADSVENSISADLAAAAAVDARTKKPIRTELGDAEQAAKDALTQAQEMAKAGENAYKFARQKAEEKPELVITHNLSSENLLHASRMGGLAVPSLAVTKAKTPLNGFGDITLVGDKRLADPKGYAKTKVFGADIYSPRYPTITHIVKPKLVEKLNQSLESARSLTGGGYIGADDIRTEGLSAIDRNPAVMATFLEQHGLKPDIAYRKNPMSDARRERLVKQGFGKFMQKQDWFDLLHDNEFKDLAIKAWNEDNATDGSELADAFYPGFRPSESKVVDPSIKGQEDRITAIEKRLANEIGDANKFTTGVEAYRTRDNLTTQIEKAKLTEQFNSFSRDLLQSLDPEEKIFQGFTNSGNRKYIPHTLDNVVKILKKELRGGENFNYGVGSLRAKFTPEFKSIDQIRKEKGRLIDANAMADIKNEIDDEFFGVLKAINPDLSTTTGMAILEDAPRLGIKAAAKSYGYELSDEAAQKAVEFLTRLKHLPTEYFEAKILRDVDLGEFSAAIVPKGVDPKVVDALKAKGVNDIRFYKAGDEADRAAKISELDHLMFARGPAAIFQQAPTAENLTNVLRASFGKSTETLLDAGRIKVVDNPKDIPGIKAPEDTKAVTAPDGTVYVVARNVSPNEATGLMLHEVGTHVGMEKMLGAPTYERLLAEVDRRVQRGEAAFVEAARKVPTDTNPNHLREETLAYLVQNRPDLPIVKRIIAAIRAWAYRTFKAAQERLELTPDDLRALAVSSLHAVAMAEREGVDALRTAAVFARAGEQAGDGDTAQPRYARTGESGPDLKAEMKPFDDAVKRSELYAAAVRAAADRVGNDDAVRSAMESSSQGKLTPQEIDSLLEMLNEENRAVRSRLNAVKNNLSAEDRATDLQDPAMVAANDLGNNLKLAAVIAKRNAALNLAARFKALSFINSEFSGNEAEGLKAVLAGSHFNRRGARQSVEAESKAFLGEWMGGITADMERAGLWELFASDAMARETARALYLMGNQFSDFSKLPKEAVEMAKIIHKYQQDARARQNRFGAWVGDVKGYIVRQSHDMFRIRAAGYQEWKNFILPRLDMDATFAERGVTDIDASLRATYENLASGLHTIHDADEDLNFAFQGQGSAMAKKVSQSRVLHFKDGDAWFDYNDQFGTRRFADAVLVGLGNASRSSALMKMLGTNPEAMLNRIMDDIEEGLRVNPDAKAKFHSERQSILNLYAHVSGGANIPGSHMGAQISSGLRAWQSMSKLGGAVVSSITDIPTYASEVRYRGESLLSGMGDALSGLANGRGTAEQKQVLSSLGVFFESMTHGIAGRFSAEDNIPGKTSKLMQQFFKWNGLTWWTETLRSSAALSTSHFLAQNVDRGWSGLSDELRNMLSLYNIDEGKWDIIRSGATQEADGRMYVTPEGLRTVSQQSLENYIESVGRTVNDASVANLRDDLGSAIRNLVIDRSQYAVLEPDARTKAFFLRGSKPGTVLGELARFIAQFKSFPTAMIQKVWGREIYGRGYDSLPDYLRRGKGDMLGMVHLMLWTTIFGYAAMSIKDMLKGKTPRDPLSPASWNAAFLQGGGAGIYGDFIFGEMRNRFGNGPLNAVVGPVIGAGDDLLELYGRVKAGDDAAARAFKFAVNNTPFVNMFYTRMALDYLLFYHVQEMLNPGYLRRMERRVEKENGQTFLLKPSEAVR